MKHFSASHLVRLTLLASLGACLPKLQSPMNRIEATDADEFARKTFFKTSAIPAGATGITAIHDLDTNEMWGCFQAPKLPFGETVSLGEVPPSRPSPAPPCWKHSLGIEDTNLTVEYLDAAGWRIVRIPWADNVTYAAISTSGVSFFWVPQLRR